MKLFLRVTAGIIAIGLCLPLAACSSSSAGSITCAEYNDLDYNKQSDEAYSEGGFEYVE